MVLCAGSAEHSVGRCVSLQLAALMNRILLLLLCVSACVCLQLPLRCPAPACTCPLTTTRGCTRPKHSSVRSTQPRRTGSGEEGTGTGGWDDGDDEEEEQVAADAAGAAAADATSPLSLAVGSACSVFASASPNPSGGPCVSSTSVWLGMIAHLARSSDPRRRLKAQSQNQGCQGLLHTQHTQIDRISHQPRISVRLFCCAARAVV